MSTERIKDLPDATLALTDRIPLESIADDVTRKFTPSALFSLLINNPATWAASASQAGILTTGAQTIGGAKTWNGDATFAGNLFGSDSAKVVDWSGGFRVKGSQSPGATGAGVELNYNGTRGIIFAIDRAATYKIMAIDGSSVELRPNGSTMLSASSTGVSLSGSLINKVTVVTGAGPTSVSSGDCNVVWKPTVTAAGQLNLPSSPNTGTFYMIVDGKGIAAANTLTISGNGKTINGAASITVTTNYGGVILSYDGTEWHVFANF